jgi:hypothetical protein
LTTTTPPAADADTALLERLRAAAELLESVAADRLLLDNLPADDRQRLFQAVAQVYHPDPGERRVRLKAAQKARHASKIQAEDTVLNQTGIRALRRKPVFTTPNVFAPEGFEANDIAPDADAAQPRESIEPKHCYVCKKKYSTIHFFYDQLCPDCAPFNYAKRTELVDLRGRVALLTGGRVKIGYQAGLKLLRAGAELIVTRASRATRRHAMPRNRTSASGVIVCRSTGWTCATRPASKRFATNWSRRGRGWTSSSITHARPCVVRPTSTRT